MWLEGTEVCEKEGRKEGGRRKGRKEGSMAKETFSTKSAPSRALCVCLFVLCAVVVVADAAVVDDGFGP